MGRVRKWESVSQSSRQAPAGLAKRDSFNRQFFVTGARAPRVDHVAPEGWKESQSGVFPLLHGRPRAIRLEKKETMEPPLIATCPGLSFTVSCE